MLNKICTMTAKSAPYPPCTVTALWLKYQDRDRMLHRLTQPPHIAGPLGFTSSDQANNTFRKSVYVSKKGSRL
jgi:hypothetical protein